MAFNRNIITKEDAANYDRALTKHDAGMPRTLGDEPPAAMPSNEPTASDEFLTQLIKFIPVEILAFYTLIASIISANTDDGASRSWWLLGAFAGSVVVAPLYMWRIGKVVRPGQNLASAFALAVYVFSVGGWFATQGWYEPWFGAIAVAVAALVLSIFNLKPLPLQPSHVTSDSGPDDVAVSPAPVTRPPATRRAAAGVKLNSVPKNSNGQRRPATRR